MNEFKKLLTRQIQNKKREVHEWLTERAKAASLPFYTSLDLRDSGFKIAPVDSNLYPAGFNNLCPEDQRTSPSVLKEQIQKIESTFKKSIHRIAILPENNTRNTFYLENLSALSKLFELAGFEVKIGWHGPLPEGESAFDQLKTASGQTIKIEPFTQTAPILQIGNWVPDLVINNNDFSAGYPSELDQTQSLILPPYQLGWHTRKKSTHFHHYNRLAQEFAQLVQIDPWLIQIDTTQVDGVDFNEDLGLDRVAEQADQTLSRIRKAYHEHGVKRRPFVFVKNNAGTYGMGIMVIKDAEEVRKLNRRSKNKMSVGKNRSEIHSVIVQEGIPTATIIDKMAAEPVIYLSGCELIGGFLRSNTERGEEDNLNSQGMIFRKLCMSDLRTLESALGSENPEKGDGSENTTDLPVLEMVYGSIARVSALAAGMEIKEYTN